jgi:hypothetical protein
VATFCETDKIYIYILYWYYNTKLLTDRLHNKLTWIQKLIK